MWNDVTDNNNKKLEKTYIFSSYKKYLSLLQERNKIYKQIRKDHQSNFEKLEKGFIVYTNGANTDKWNDVKGTDIYKWNNKIFHFRKHQHFSKTSSLVSLGISPHYDLQFYNCNLQRKNWNFQPYHIMTETGSTVTVDFQEHDLSSTCDIFSDIADAENEEEECENNSSGSVQLSNPSQLISGNKHTNIHSSLRDLSQLPSDHIKDKLNSRNLESSNNNLFSTDHCEIPLKLSQCKKAWMLDCASAEINNTELNLTSKDDIPVIQNICNYKTRSSSKELYIVDEKEEFENSEHQILNEDLIKKIVNHIVTMDPRKQNTLLKVLGIIENSAADDDSHDSSMKEFQQDSNHKNDTSQSSISSVRERPSFKSANFKKQEFDIESDSNSFKSSQSPAEVFITFELLSNYGHPKRIGLTEVEFLNPLGDRLETNVICTTMTNVVGELTNILNGKTKVTNEENMWSCELPDKSFISLLFTVYMSPKNYKNSNNLYISSIRIWNYNKDIKLKFLTSTVDDDSVIYNISLCGSNTNVILWNLGLTHAVICYTRGMQCYPVEELDIGVRRAKIIIGENIIFDGEFQQGCGNETCDYSQTIYLDPSIQFGTRCGLSPKQKSNKDHINYSSKNVTEYNFEKFITTTKNLRDEVNSIQWLNNIPSLDITNMNTYHSREDNASNKSSRERSVSSSCLEEGKEIVHSIKRPMSESMGRKPKWYEDMRCKPPLLNSRTNSIEKPTWLLSKNEVFQDDYLETRKSNTCRSNSVEKIDFFDFSINKSESDTLFDDDMKTSREPSARYGRRAPKNNHSDSGYKSEKDRAQSRVSINDNSQLEDYWLSLHVFEHSHKGRLNMFVDTEGDILDMYMKEEKLKRQQLYNDQVSNIPHSEMDNVQLVDLDFIIPELPEGQHLTLNILTTWGDKHYVGLNGIEIFCDSGHLVEVEKLWADPADINILPEYSCDPRVISNLIDGVYRTHDDMHLWLAPFTPNSNHYIYIMFKQSVKIAMIRIWNYNKSRIHSYRGARHMEMILDGHPIFKGEIARACGEIQGSTEAFGDTILFTTDEDILEAISHHDNAFNDDDEISMPINLIVERPDTSDPGCSDERPFTAATSPSYSVEPKKYAESLPYQEIEKKVYSCTCILFTLLSGWSDHSEIGITGLELIGSNGIEAIHLSSDMISLPSDESCENLSRLINGINITVNKEHMYLFESKEDNMLSFLIKFNNPEIVNGFRIWNYNGSPDDVYKGVKYLAVSLDGRCVSPPGGYLIRKGPGNCHFDFAQEIRFDSVSSPYHTNTHQIPSPRLGKSTDDSISDYESPVMPHGFIFQLQLLSTWGDAYYIGLNGLEIYDMEGRKISLTESNIAAYPDSINILKDVNNDIRTPDKLIDNVNNTLDGRHMWLAPILPGVLTRVYIIFDYPVTISMIKLWNYAKTPTRGVKEFGLLIDDLLVYNGVLAQVHPGFETIPYHTILFTTNRDILSKEKNTVVRNQDVDHSVQLTNKTELQTKGSAEIADQALRPTTGVGPIYRTSQMNKR